MKYCPDAYKKKKGRPNRIPLKVAMNRIYLVKGRLARPGNKTGHICLPMCMIGKRVKLVLVGDEVPQLK